MDILGDWNKTENTTDRHSSSWNSPKSAVLGNGASSNRRWWPF